MLGKQNHLLWNTIRSGPARTARICDTVSNILSLGYNSVIFRSKGKQIPYFTEVRS